MSLAEALAVVGLLAVAVAAAAAMLVGTARDGRRAALEGRRAEAALRAADRLRAGLAPGDSGTIRLRVLGEPFDVHWSRVHAAPAGGLSLRVEPAGTGPGLLLGPAVVTP